MRQRSRLRRTAITSTDRISPLRASRYQQAAAPKVPLLLWVPSWSMVYVPHNVSLACAFTGVAVAVKPVADDAVTLS
jgi:hypothetical protein